MGYLKSIFAKKVPYTGGLNAMTSVLKEFLDVFNDDHVLSDFQDNDDIPQILNDLQPSSTTYLIGDNYDRTCCKMKDVEKVTRLIYAAKAKHGHRYVFGNHEAMGSHPSDNYVVHEFKSGKRVLLTHGDLESDPVKWMKYREKEGGAGLVKLWRTKIFDHLDIVKGNVLYKNLPDGFLERAAAKAKSYDCTYYVCGHFHVETERRYKVGDITVIVLPAHNKNRSKVWF
jgi:predicted MPP superfamily phosphohydrolase